MARIKNGITKSGASLLNERTQASIIYNQQTNQPYIPNGTNVDKLSIVTKYNDQNTINFDHLKYLTPQTYFTQHPNERSILDELIATPSTMPNDLGLSISENFYDNFSNNQSQIIDKFLKKVNSVQLNYTPFKDIAYTLPTNSTIQQDFIKGEGKFYFLNTNLYEETSIDIELDVPADALLEYTAKMQEFDNTNPFTFNFSTWDNSPYSFRKNSDNGHIRTNSPFLMYNFKQNCFEGRGYSRGTNLNDQLTYGNSNPILEIPNVNFIVDDDTIKINNRDESPSSKLKYQTFKTNLNSNLKNHNFALSHTPIQDLNTVVDEDIGLNQVCNYFSIPSMQFGFPHFPVFHTFDDNLLSMSKYLNKPLIIDRVTVELDVKLKSEITTSQENEDLYIGQGLNFSLNYMILNSPKNFKDSKLRAIVSNPFQLKKDIYQTQNTTETFNNQPSTLTAFADGDWPTFSQTHSSNPILNFVLRDFQQNLPVKRKFFKIFELNEEDILTSDTFNKSSFNNNIVSFGNVVFHAPHPDNIEEGKTYKQTHLTELSQLINNNTLIIDTFRANSFNLDMLPQDKICLDYDGKVKLNDYVKKVGNLSLDFAANNINHQFEFFSNTYSTLQLQSELEYNPNLNVIGPSKAFYDNSLNITRNMINNMIDGKDVINTFSFLDFDKKNHGNIPAPIFRKTALNLFSNTFPTNEVQRQKYYTDNIEGKIQTGFYKKPIQEFSPYVLTPDDNLAFCFSISPTIAPKLFKHSCQIKSGKVKFTLHGYQKKNNQIFIDDTSLNQNLNTTIIGDNSIVTDDYNNVGYLEEFILTFNDRIFQGTFNDENNPRKLKGLEEQTANFDNSKIKSGKSYIPYLKLEPVINTKWIYDNDIVFSQILNQLLSANNQNPDISKYLTSYRGVIDPNINPPPSSISNNFDKGKIEYFDFNIAAATAPFKLDLKNLSAPIAQINIDFETEIAELLTIPILGPIIAAAFILDKLSTTGFINKRYNFSSYYSNKKYGQFINTLQQRLFTTEMSFDVNNQPVVEYVLEQKFIDNMTGVELTDLTNSLIPHNKSKNLQLIDSRNIVWSVEEFFKLKHVAYDDALTEIFI